MGLFSDLNLSVTTPGGTFALAGGKLSLPALPGAQPQLPERAIPPPAALPWYKRPPVLLGIAGGVVLLILLRR